MYLGKGASIDLFGLNFFPTRLLGLAGFVNVVRSGAFPANLNSMDRAFLVAYGYATMIFLLRTGLGYGTSAEVTQITTMSKFALMIDMTLGYFAFRGLIENVRDLTWLLRALVTLLIPYVALLSLERLTGHNPLAIVGSIPDIWIDGARQRCVGSFMHPSLLGSFGASFMLLYIGLTFSKENRVKGAAGVLLCLGIVFLSNSGGPLSFAAVGIGAWLLWPVRTKMEIVRRLMLAMLVVLALIMKDPLWYLPTKISLLFGGSGWHRSYLMHQAAAHVDQWWLAGMPMDQTRDWFPYLVEGAADMTNLFLVFGVDAGLLGMFFLVFFFAKAFRQLGLALSITRRNAKKPNETEYLLWGLGCAHVGHIINFFAITYFDQTAMVWLMQLAAIASLSRQPVDEKAVEVSTSTQKRQRVRYLPVPEKVECSGFAIPSKEHRPGQPGRRLK